MKKIIFVFTLLLCFACVSFADEASHRKIAEEVLQSLKLDKTLAQMFDRMLEMQKQQLKGVVDQEDALVVQEKVAEIYKKEFSWQNTKEDYIDVYVENFTESELVELSKFYNSVIGKKLLKKQPELMKRGMEIGQKYMQKAVPKVHEMIRGEIKSVEEKKKAVEKEAEEKMEEEEK